MALPSQAVEKIIRDPSKTPGTYRDLMVFSGVIFLLVVAIYAGLAFGYVPYLDSRVEQLDADIATFAAEVPVEEQKEVALFYSELINLRTLLSSRTFASPAFVLLEDSVLPGVYFSKASLNTANREVVISGVTRNPDDVATQARVFEADPRVDRVNFESASLDGAEWQFSMALFMTSEPISPSATSQ